MDSPKTILYLSHAPRVSKVFLPVASALREIAPRCRQLCAGFGRDVFPGLPGEPEERTFDGTCVDFRRLVSSSHPREKPDENCWDVFARSIDALLVDEDVSALVVPHDFPGFHQVAVRLAARRHIPSVVIQEALQDFAAFGEPRIKEIAFEETDALSNCRPRSEFRNLLSKQKVVLKDACRLALKWIRANARAHGHPPTRPGPSPRLAPDTWWWFGQSGASRIAVTGDYYSRRLVSKGVPEERISVVGYTRGDLLLSQKPLPRRLLLQEIGLPPDSRFALAVSQDFGNWKWPTRVDHTAALLETARILERLAPNLRFVLLAHPGESLQSLRKRVAQARLARTIAIKAADNHMSLYEACDFLVGFWSTCLVESMLVRRPIVTLDYALVDSFVPNLIEGGAVIPVLRGCNLHDQLHRLLTDRPFVEQSVANQRRVLVDLFHYPDGCAGVRAARCIVSAIAPDPSADPDTRCAVVEGEESEGVPSAACAICPA